MSSPQIPASGLLPPCVPPPARALCCRRAHPTSLTRDQPREEASRRTRHSLPDSIHAVVRSPPARHRTRRVCCPSQRPPSAPVIIISPPPAPPVSHIMASQSPVRFSAPPSSLRALFTFPPADSALPCSQIRRKLVIVGDGACGKTSLLCSFALGEFPKEYVRPVVICLHGLPLKPSRLASNPVSDAGPARASHADHAVRSHLRELRSRDQARREAGPARTMGYRVRPAPCLPRAYPNTLSFTSQRAGGVRGMRTAVA